MNMLFILKGQDLTPIFRAHACARSALRARQSRWRLQRSSPRAALGAVISISAAPVARMRRGGPRAAGQSVSEGARAGCCGSGAPLGTQSCAAGAHATTADRLPTRTFLLLNPAFVPY
jgi:hypothetical protein